MSEFVNLSFHQSIQWALKSQVITEGIEHSSSSWLKNIKICAEDFKLFLNF